METSDEGITAERRRRLLFLCSPFLLALALSAVGTALSPWLLVSAPLLLVALSPGVGYVILVAPLVDPVLLYAVVVTRMFATDPFMYQAGAEFGDDALAWLRSRSPNAARWVVWCELSFAKWAIPTLFLVPGALVCLLAGMVRLSRPLFVVVNLMGTVMWVTICLFLGSYLRDTVLSLRAFIEANVLLLTVGCLCTGGLLWLKRRLTQTKP